MTSSRLVGPPPTIVLIGAAMLSALPTTMILPSLPNMAADFGASEAVTQLTISAFLFTSALVQLIAGPLSDRFGRRPVMMGAIIVALVGGVICLFAPTIEIAILGRIFQAASFSTIALSRAIIRDIYSSEESASKIGYVTMGMAIGPLIAPTLGGFLTETIHWRANFVVLLAMGSILLGVIYFTLGETNKTEFSSFRAQINQYPELFGSRRFWGLTLTAAFNSGAYYAFLGGGAFVAVNVYHMSPTEFGAYYAFLVSGYIVGNFFTGRFAARIGPSKMALLGSVVTVVGGLFPIFFLMVGFTHPLYVFIPLFLLSIGNGLTLPSVLAAMVSVRPHIAGSASGLGGTIQVGGAAIISVIAGLLVEIFSANYTLFVIMTASAFLSVLTTVYVIMRARTVGAGSDGNL